MALTGLVAANNLGDVVDIERTWDNIGSNISATVFVPAATLDLNFAGNKSLVDNISGSGLVTFTRASSGTFVGSNGLIQSVASGVPRFDHDPVTGESLGLLVEEARTNFNLYSEQFDNAWWVPINVSLVPNTIIAPNGNLIGDKLIENTATTQHYNLGNSTTPGPATFTSSVFVKAGERTAYQMLMSDFATGGPTLKVNLSTGTIISLGTTGQWSNSSASVINFGNGWYRVSLTSTLSNSALPRIAHHLLNASNADTYTGDGASGLYLFGAQVELGAFPTSYIPTTTIPLLRSADVASITGTNFSRWYNQSEGTIYTDYSLQNISTPYTMALTDNTSANSINFAINSNYMAIVAANILQYERTLAIKLGKRKQILAFASNNVNSVVDEVLGAVDTIATIPLMDRMVFTGNTIGTIARLTYYPVRLSNITLQALSTLGPVSSFPYSFSIKGRDILALKEVNKTSTRDFVFIKGLLSRVQPRINTASQYTASGVALRNAAMLKVAPTTIGNYFFSSGLTLSGTTVQINGTNARSIATSPFSGSTALYPLLFGGLRPQANWRITEPMTSGTVTSPESAIPIETSDFLLFIKAGQS